MNETILNLLMKKFSTLKKGQVEKTLEMLMQGDTVPFIARYRKEVTGALDEVEIHDIWESYGQLETLEKRKQAVLSAIEEQGKLTSELKKEILSAEKLQIVEDLYRPFKQKRRTKATIAKEAGLEGLAKLILSLPKEWNKEKDVSDYLNEEKGIQTIEDALAGAHEILAEEMSDNAKLRKWTRDFTQKNGMVTSTVKSAEKDEKSVFEMYYDFSESVARIQNHRILALNRGEKEGILTVKIALDEEKIFDRYEREFLKRESAVRELIEFSIRDAYKRFIAPSIERELRNELTARADEAAIAVFGENLKNLLLQSPLKNKVILGFDPAYRTGAKLAIIDPTGKMLTTDVIYPVKPANTEKIKQSEKRLIELIEQYQVEMIAIGNGTASRESEQFVANALKKIKREVFYTIVNEAGASVYSASEIARNEFPELTVEKRSAISIARRLQDPLAELVKIEPKAVGVGQYQHDVSQKRLGEELDFVIETAVNKVGVDVNTASAELLVHISGLNKTTAHNLVTYREEIGQFTTRTQIKKVSRLGAKSYEQAIGFLRIPQAKNILDETSIHPESYALTKEVLSTLSIDVKKLREKESKEKLKNANIARLSEELNAGVPTLSDIVEALQNPNRDMREEMPKPILRSDVLSMEDLTVGMKLKGTVRNVVDFGAFVDIGVKQDGLVHLSKISEKYLKHPSDVAAVGDVVDVWVDAIDTNKGRISLRMIEKK
ncbi:uncharacterized protein SAMN02745116_01566 [Pilibacter termitis]|uniref:S1 motif domain-containing protein n=1 Tax=Pilibacter termitis TaxID=263852 RepID=A0A1T4NWM9_9ENTE|nr:Tex family protein [Pilibacter termitis]SJZ83623.1 uncharacterized protein SAMN02745116_01566 [Pilibacter termitis]